MNIIKSGLLATALLFGIQVSAQQKASKLKLLVGVGASNYFGDLIQGNKFYSQPSVAFSSGFSYSFTEKISARLDLGILKVRGHDSKNKDVQYRNRNLSFKSNIFEMSVSGEYSILSLNRFKVSPYISAGVGIMTFTPYANDISGKKYSLRELDTEGRALAGGPGRYNDAAFIFPVGFGFKYQLCKTVTMSLDFNYRFTSTDYLDDVSSDRYPDKALLDARNPITSKFTWRGNEVGGDAYPKNLTLPRGNPKDDDGYYTTMLKFAFNL